MTKRKSQASEGNSFPQSPQIIMLGEDGIPRLPASRIAQLLGSLPSGIQVSLGNLELVIYDQISRPVNGIHAPLPCKNWAISALSYVWRWGGRDLRTGITEKTQHLLNRLLQAAFCRIYYGFETCSDRILALRSLHLFMGIPCINVEMKGVKVETVSCFSIYLASFFHALAGLIENYCIHPFAHLLSLYS